MTQAEQPIQRIPGEVAQPQLQAPESARRLRLAMHSALLVVALAVWLLCALGVRLHNERDANQLLLKTAGQHSLLAQQVGREAALLLLVAPDHLAQRTAELSLLLARSTRDALALEALVAPAWSASETANAMTAWQAARERLWYRAQLLVLTAETDAPDTLRANVLALQAEVEPAQAAAQWLVVALNNTADAQDQMSQRQLLQGTAALLLLLGLVAAGVVEPTARWLARRAHKAEAHATNLRRLALVAEHTSALVLITDEQDCIVWANTAFTTTTGWSLDQARRCNPMDLLHHGSADSAVLAQVNAAIAAGQGTRHEWLHRARCGVSLWLDVDLRPVHNSSGSLAGFVRVASDATERRSLQDQLRKTARTDALTLLPNRAVVVDRLQRAIAHHQRNPGYGFAVLYMDFDRFKVVNDTQGHGAGDNMLRQIAQRLQIALRPGDSVALIEPDIEPDHSLLDTSDNLAARLGGDEFVVVLDGVASAATLASLADRLLADLSQPFLLGSTPVQSSASIGVVLVGGQAVAEGVDAQALSAESVLRDADTAMYEAKRAGRGRWVLFNPSMHERVVRALALERDLKHALAHNELFVVYQPVVDLATRTMTGVEALVRWRHPTRGLVPPLEFIPVAEESGLIDAVGAVVLRLACTQFVQWRHSLGARAPRLLAVNLSRAQLQRAGLVAEVEELLASCKMAPEHLQLEVTESLAAQDERVQNSLRGLKNLGVKLALDDFGTGYSSLACLHLLPVDTVKIDRSFVQHAQTVDYHRVLIEATIRVAQTLGMTTVAEGIETEGQAQLMLQLACDRGQGYLFAKPLDAAALEAHARLGDTATV